MIKKITLLSGLALANLFSAQINFSESFEGYLNPWANSEMPGLVFVSSTQYFCEGEQAAGALLGSMLGEMGKGPKTMISPYEIEGNNNEKLNISYSAIIVQANANYTDFEAIPSGSNWGTLKLLYSLDGGVSWSEANEVNSTNYTSKVTCTQIDLVIPKENMGTNSEKLLLKFVADRNSTFTGLLTFIIDNLVLKQDGRLSVSDVSNSNLQIYPNPAQNYFILNGDDGRLQLVNIYSLDGKLIKSVSSNNNKFDISDLNTGVYVVRTKYSKKSFKLVKK